MKLASALILVTCEALYVSGQKPVSAKVDQTKHEILRLSMPKEGDFLPDKKCKLRARL